VHVSHGQDAVQLARRDQPTVVFLEADSPAEISAWQVLKALKADQATRAIPVVLFSWVNEEEHAIEAGVDVYVQKPVMYVDFIDALAVAGICQSDLDTQPSDPKGGALSSPEG
jgi:CheY-like chemotaxis protein